jgi:hypothetical protein
VRVGESLEVGPRLRVLCERIGQRARDLDVAGRGVEFERDLDGIAGLNSRLLTHVAIDEEQVAKLGEGRKRFPVHATMLGVLRSRLRDLRACRVLR